MVDQNAALGLIDELRVAVPEEVRAAKRINSAGERIIEKANEEAARITARAQEQATYLIGEKGLTEAAQAEGRQIVSEAMAAADDTRAGADEYAAQILSTLETEVRKALAGIEKGMLLTAGKIEALRHLSFAGDVREHLSAGPLRTVVKGGRRLA